MNFRSLYLAELSSVLRVFLRKSHRRDPDVKADRGSALPERQTGVTGIVVAFPTLKPMADQRSRGGRPG